MEITTETGDARSATLMLHLLGRCNLTCQHCYMEGSPRREEKLPLKFVLRAVGECAQLGIATLYLTGGEPLLYPGLEDVIWLAAQTPQLAITVCTNATLVKPSHAALLKGAGAKVNVSVDGDAEFHDGFRGLRGAFRATERGVALLVEHGIPVTIVTTMSKSNLRQLPAIAEWAAKVGVVQFRVQPLLKLGRGSEISDERLDSHEMDLLLLQLTDMANTYGPRGMKCNVIGASRNFLRKHPCGAYVCNGQGCHRRVAQEIKKLVVREDGTVLPEVTNLSREFAIGHLGEDSLFSMVNRYFEDGYARFDRLCRSLYSELLDTWKSEFIPWDQIVAERSHAYRDQPLVSIAAAGCGVCAPHQAEVCCA